MNKKILVILATGTLLAASVTAAACAAKKPQAAETAPAASILIAEPAADPMSFGNEDPVVIKSLHQADPEVKPAGVIEIEDLVLLNTKPAATKKVSKKAVKKTVTKTFKKTKKPTKKPAKKPSKTSGKNTAKFTYGRSVYTYQNMAVYLTINKDNTVDFSAVETKHNAPEVQYEICWQATGTLDPKTNTIVYKDCVKRLIVFTNTGKNFRTHYSNGHGKVTLNGKTLKWNDNSDQRCGNFTFVKA